MDLINRDDVIDIIGKMQMVGLAKAHEMVENIPTATVHGEWMWRHGGSCSECGYQNTDFTYNFCPNCGAKMEGEREQAIRFLVEQPYKVGHMVGFDKLEGMHNRWIQDMVRGRQDKTLQAHRGSYKTTSVSIALAIICILMPGLKVAFFRKTEQDVKEIIRQTKNILTSDHIRYFVRCIYGVELTLTERSLMAISTNLSNDNRGASQLVGMGIFSSLTGRHFDRIFTDDIVNVKDRASRAEREQTKIVYQELQNIKNRGGRIYNTGTPWHKEDCFTLMPNPEKYDCYTTGLISEEELDSIRKKMTPSLFAANYELRHISSDMSPCGTTRRNA